MVALKFCVSTVNTFKHEKYVPAFRYHIIFFRHKATIFKMNQSLIYLGYSENTSCVNLPDSTICANFLQEKTVVLLTFKTAFKTCLQILILQLLKHILITRLVPSSYGKLRTTGEYYCSLTQMLQTAVVCAIFVQMLTSCEWFCNSCTKASAFWLQCV